MRSERSRAQAMTEFAIVARILFFMLLGIVESGLLLFVVGSARFGAGEVARQESESGNAANADQVSLQVLQRTAIGTTSLSQVIEVDIYRLIEQGNGTLTVDNAHYNRCQLDGTPIGGITWPSTTRNVINGQSDFLGVTAQYRYSWNGAVNYNGHRVRFEVPVPGIYSSGSNPNNRWWSLRYQITTNVTDTDTLTFAVGLKGNPAHLLIS